MRLVPALAALIATIALFVPGHARPRGAPGAQTSSLDAEALRRATSWPEQVARDARLSFSSGSAREAREQLAPADGGRSPLASAEERAAAYLAVGAGGDVRDRPLLESGAAAGDANSRVGAVFGLGELRPPGVAALLSLADDAEPLVAAAACVALARSGDAGALSKLETWRDGAGPRASAADHALRFRAGGLERSPGPEIDALLALRWASARRYGFVDGLRWRVYLEAELARDEAFLDRVILVASAKLRAGPRRDHLLELVLAGGTPERLRGAVAGCPDALSALIDAGLWRPQGKDEWSALLAELSARKITDAELPLLKHAAQVPGFEVRAGLLLVGANVREAYSLVSEEQFAPQADRRLALAEALGGLSDPKTDPDLSRLRRDRDPRVRAAAMVSQARRGDVDAGTSLSELLGSGPSDPRSQVLQMLARAVRDPIAETYLIRAQLLSDLTSTERVLVEVALASVGRTPQRGALRDMLAVPGVGGGLKELIVRALSNAPERDDLAAMRAMFPVEDSRSLNVELALALIETRDPGALGLLRQGLWRGPWNRSVLAAGLLARHGGIQVLHDELASPPPGASDSDLRRVGFALGEWGGLSEVDALARRRRASDPAVQGAFLGALATRTQ